MEKITVTIEVEGNAFRNLDEESMGGRRMDTYSMYARFYDESCPDWTSDSHYNLMLLKMRQEHANELLKSKGHLFLNDVYDLLGMPRSKAGQVVGWVYDEHNPIGDNFVDFGIYDDSNSDFVNGYTRTIVLDFNVDGYILDRI